MEQAQGLFNTKPCEEAPCCQSSVDLGAGRTGKARANGHTLHYSL